MRRFLATLALLTGYAVSCQGAFDPYYVIKVDIQTPTDQFVIDRAFLGNNTFIAADVYTDGVAYTNLTDWAFRLFYSRTQFATSGVTIAASSVSSNRVYFQGATNTYFDPFDDYWVSLVGTATNGLVKTFGTGRLIVEHDPFAGSPTTLVGTTPLNWNLMGPYSGTWPIYSGNTNTMTVTSTSTGAVLTVASSGGGSTSTLYRVVSTSALIQVTGEYGPSAQIGLSSSVLTTATLFTGDVRGVWNDLQLQAGTVASSNIIDATIATADIADDAVSGDKIAADSILSTHISDGEIENADIGAAAAIAQSKIAGLTSLAAVVTSATGTLATVVASDALKLTSSHWAAADSTTNYLQRSGGTVYGATIFSNSVQVLTTTVGADRSGVSQSGSSGGSLQMLLVGYGSNTASGTRFFSFIQNGRLGSGSSDATGTNQLTVSGTIGYGVMQSGILNSRYGRTMMNAGGYASMQRGYLDAESNAYAYATNSGYGSIGLFNITASEGTISGQLVSGHAAIGLGACVVTNNEAIVAGSGLVSHGDKSITADSFWGAFNGDGTGVTNVSAQTFQSLPMTSFVRRVAVGNTTNITSGSDGLVTLAISETSTFANVISRGGSLAASALTNIPAQSITGAIPAAVITASTIATGTPVYAAITQLQAGALGGVVVSNSGAIGYVSATNQGIGWSGVVATQTVNMAGNAVTNLNRIGLVGQTNLVPIRGDLFASNGVVYFVGTSGSSSAQYGENNLTIGNYQTIASAQAAATNYARWLGNSPPTSNTANGSHMEVRMNQTNIFIYNVASGKWFRITGSMEWP